MTTRDRVTFPLIALLSSILLMGQTCGMDLDPNTNQNQNDNENDNTQTEPVARVYGDGSAGAKVVSGDENWNTADNRQTNLQFTDLIIEEGVTLTIPSGMTIRCKGKFENKGTLFVRHGAEGGFAGLDDPNGPDFAFVATQPALGIATRSAQQGETGSSATALRAGTGAAGLSEFESRVILAPSTNAGSGGAAGGMDTDTNTGISSNEGADGGGSVVIIAQAGVVNDGTILAEGQDGKSDSGVDLGGGGGGGIVILASTTSVTNNGMISTSGGNGADSDSNNGPSGGGGGGIVHLIAPEITNDGDAVSEGGAAGANTAPVTDDAERFAGGGGGSGGGAGGQGGSIPAGSGPLNANAATAGASGFVFLSEQDPQSILK